MSVILMGMAGTLLVIGSGLVLFLLAQVDGVSSQPDTTSAPVDYAPPRAA